MAVFELGTARFPHILEKDVSRLKEDAASLCQRASLRQMEF